ncbi:hypothetical protein ACWC0A_35275 [Streptomyces scopuliridis]
MTGPGGPGHDDTDIPLFVCRACEKELMAMRAEVLRNPVRPYVNVGHTVPIDQEGQHR